MFKFLKIVCAAALLLLLALFIYIQSQKVSDKPVTALKEKWAHPPSTFINIDGMDIHIRDEGPRDAAETIVLLHGTGASLHTWNGWTKALSQTHRVIRFDLPAFGLTGPDPGNDYSIERYAEVVIHVLDALNIERVVLGGNSLGGYIAWATAVLHKERVSKLILVDASGYPYQAESVPLAFKVSQSKIAKTVLHNFLPKWLVARSVKNVYGNPEAVSDEIIERYYQLTLREGNRAALAERFVQTKPGPLANRVPDIGVPALILWGAKDRLIPVKFAHRFNNEISHSELIIFDQLGHVPQEESPALTVEPVMTFLKGTGGPL